MAVSVSAIAIHHKDDDSRSRRGVVFIGSE
jgi:hypothetical protein